MFLVCSFYGENSSEAKFLKNNTSGVAPSSAHSAIEMGKMEMIHVELNFLTYARGGFSESSVQPEFSHQQGNLSLPQLTGLIPGQEKQ